MLEVTAKGEMYVDGGKRGNVREDFQEKFLMHSKFNEGNMPNSVIKNMLIKGRLRDKNKEFKGLKTCRAISVKEVNTKVKLMSKEEIYGLDLQPLREYAAQLGFAFKGSILGRPDDMRAKLLEKTEALKSVGPKKSVTKKSEDLESEDLESEDLESEDEL